MHSFRLRSVLRLLAQTGALLACAQALAANDACKLLSAEKFSEIAGYAVQINAKLSSPAMCAYKGAGDAGGMLMIINEQASPQGLAMANGPGAAVHGDNGKLGGSFSKGSVVFSVGMTGTDPAKVTALGAEVKRNLK